MASGLGIWNETLIWWANRGLGSWSRRSAFRKFARRNNGHLQVVNTKHGFAMEVRIGDPVDTALAISQTFEPQLCAVLKTLSRPGMTFVDVGCNIGFITCLIAASNPGSRIIAIDANPEMARRCRENLARNGYTAEVINHGVGETVGELEFFVTDDRPSMGSFGAAERTREQIAAGRARAFRVPVRPLPVILREQGISRVDLLKVDIEGFEPALFAGLAADESAPPIAALVFEYAPSHCQRCGFDVADMWRLPWWSRYRLEAMCIEDGRRAVCRPGAIPAWADTMVATLV